MTSAIYLDYAATTPVRAEALAAMRPYFRQMAGNPSSPHSYGAKSKAMMLGGHDRLGKLLGVSGRDLFFTGTATEGLNTAIKGVFDARGFKGHLVCSPVEHHAVINACRYVEKRGVAITWLKVDKEGRVDPGSVIKALCPDTLLVCVMHGNNEIGTVQPVEEIAHITRRRGVLLLVDGVQALGRLPVDLEKAGIDFYAMSAHKVCGPKGIGAMYARDGIDFTPLIHGGGQEKGRRSGTPNVTGVAGFVAAAELAVAEMAAEAVRLEGLRERLSEGIQGALPEAVRNSPRRGCLPHILSFSFPGLNAKKIIQALDLEGVYVSAGAACGSASEDPSHVLLAIGRTPELALGAVRFSLGRQTTRPQIDRAIAATVRAVRRARAG